MDAKTFGDSTESLIPCPQKRVRIYQGRGYQVSIGYADPEAIQVASLNQRPHFVQLRHSNLWQEIE